MLWLHVGIEAVVRLADFTYTSVQLQFSNLTATAQVCSPAMFSAVRDFLHTRRGKNLSLTVSTPQQAPQKTRDPVSHETFTPGHCTRKMTASRLYHREETLRNPCQMLETCNSRKLGGLANCWWIFEVNLLDNLLEFKHKDKETYSQDFDK